MDFLKLEKLSLLLYMDLPLFFSKPSLQDPAVPRQAHLLLDTSNPFLLAWPSIIMILSTPQT